ncbi:hypothetical protein L210DRAFT_3765305, partial [Boletus edulis BED1]
MSTSPNFNAPEWLRRLSQIPSRIFNASVDAASRLFSASWRHLVNGWNAARDFAAAHPKFTAAVIALVALVLAMVFPPLLAKGIVTAIFGFIHCDENPVILFWGICEAHFFSIL